MTKYKLTYEIIYHYTFELDASNEDEAFDNHEFNELNKTSEQFIEYNLINTEEITNENTESRIN